MEHIKQDRSLDAIKVKSKRNKERVVQAKTELKNEIPSKNDKNGSNITTGDFQMTKTNMTKETQEYSENLLQKQLRKIEWEKKLAAQKEKGDLHSNRTENKADIRAKRRGQQEAQRLAKTLIKNESTARPKVENSIVKNFNKHVTKKNPDKEINVSNTHEVQLVKHLYVKDAFKYVPTLSGICKDIHPAFIKLGMQFMNKTILGSNARCLALLAALRSLVNDLETPPKQEFCRYMEVVLQLCTNYLQKCRPFAVSMTNALRYFKLQLTQIDTNQKDNEKKAKLIDIIDTYINNDIKKAGDAISIKVNEKIHDGDVLLTYGCSSLIRKILIEAHQDGKKFEVIIVDGRPFLEGKEMLRSLTVAGIQCTYILINSVCYVIGRTTKIILGAHALLTNGYVVSRIGTAQIALAAQAYNKPVLVCCETYKFSERVQTDSFVYNEIDDPNLLSSSHIFENFSPLNYWKNIKMLTPLNLLYDVTPPDLVSAVVTEIAILPCTSVPVVLRINAIET